MDVQLHASFMLVVLMDLTGTAGGGGGRGFTGLLSWLTPAG